MLEFIPIAIVGVLFVFVIAGSRRAIRNWCAAGFIGAVMLAIYWISRLRGN